MGPGWGMALVVSTTIGYASALRLAQKLFELTPEGTRKLFHVGGGAIALALPWIFDVVWPVVVLGAAAVAGFLLLRSVPTLKAGAGQLIHAVPRESAGEIWFLTGIVTVFWVAYDNVLHYSIAILTLALADTTAALIGVFYGRHLFEVTGGTKSAEGSSAFLLMAFLCVHVPLLLFGDVGRAETLLVAAIIAVLLMLTEAIAWRGTDNFVVPVLVVLVLEAYQEMGPAELSLHLAVAIALWLFAFIYRRHTTLSEDALLGTALVGYSLWALADWRWLVAPITFFTTYTLLVKPPDLAKSRPFHAPVLLSIATAPVLIAATYRITDAPWLFFPFNASIAGSMALVSSLHRRLVDESESAMRVTVLSATSGVLVLLPTLLVVAWSVEAAHLLAATVLAVILAATLFNYTGRPLCAEPTRHVNWLAFPLTVGAVILVSFGALYAATGGQ